MNVISKLSTKGHKYQDYLLKNKLFYKNLGETDLLLVLTRMQSELMKRTHEENSHFKANEIEDLIQREFFIPYLLEKLRAVWKTASNVF